MRATDRSVVRVRRCLESAAQAAGRVFSARIVAVGSRVSWAPSVPSFDRSAVPNVGFMAFGSMAAASGDLSGDSRSSSC